MTLRHCYIFTRKKATALVHLSHCNSVHRSVCPSVTQVEQPKMVQAKITKSSPSTAWKTQEP